MSATGNVLLDTSVVAAHFRGDPALTSRLAEPAVLCLPWVVLGELHYGAQRAARRGERLAQIQDFLGIVALVLPDRRTAERYGQIKAGLAQAGTPIPENDIWLAALACELGLPVATRDRHFAQVPGLQVLLW